MWTISMWKDAAEPGVWNFTEKQSQQRSIETPSCTEEEEDERRSAGEGGRKKQRRLKEDEKKKKKKKKKKEEERRCKWMEKLSRTRQQARRSPGIDWKEN